MKLGNIGKTGLSRIRVWDLPLRLAHWLLALSILAAVITGKAGGLLIDWHGRVGLLILGLIAFRLAWGFVGSTHARFAHFVPGPATLRTYLNGEWRGVGHNPLGALSVLLLIAVTATQAAAGLFANDDIAFSGPLADVVSKNRSDSLTGIHATLFYLLLALVGMHLAAIGYYARIKGENLVQPMLTGDKIVPAHLAEPARGGGTVAFLVTATLAAGLVWLVGSGTLASWIAPTPAMPPAAPSPAW
jgi:cytochrome b